MISIVEENNIDKFILCPEKYNLGIIVLTDPVNKTYDCKFIMNHNLLEREFKSLDKMFGDPSFITPQYHVDITNEFTSDEMFRCEFDGNSTIKVSSPLTYTGSDTIVINAVIFIAQNKETLDYLPLRVSEFLPHVLSKSDNKVNISMVITRDRNTWSHIWR